MCGRIILTHKPTAISGFLPELQFDAWTGPRFNIAPTESVATLLNDGSGQVHLTRWGLIPSWAKDASIGNKMINARAETLLEKPAFKGPLKMQRCVILADGFYEWKAKQPMLIRLRSKEVFSLAGLWDRWTTPEGAAITSVTIITTEPNELMAEIHNRMPVILQTDWVSKWLSVDPIQSEELSPALSSFPADQMEAYAVSTLVNKPGVDSPDCISPADSMSLGL